MADGQVKPSDLEAEAGYLKRRFSFDEFWRLWEDGTLEAGDESLRFELWDGEIIMVPPPDGRHGRPHGKLNTQVLKQLISLGLEDDFPVFTQYGLRLAEDVYVGPDLMVLEGQGAEDERYPPLNQVRLVAETSQTSLRGDLEIKRDKYAEAGIPEYWVQDVENRCLHVFRDPASGRYRNGTKLEGDETVSPLFAPRITIRVSDLF